MYTLYRAEGLYTVQCTGEGPSSLLTLWYRQKNLRKLGCSVRKIFTFSFQCKKYSNKTFLKSRYFSTKLLRKTYFKIFQFKRAQSDSILWLTCSWSSRGWRLRGSSGWRLMRPGSWRLTRLHNWRMRCCQRCGDRTQVM